MLKKTAASIFYLTGYIDSFAISCDKNGADSIQFERQIWPFELLKTIAK